jgi:hypothetical protein
MTADDPSVTIAVLRLPAVATARSFLDDAAGNE